MKIHYNLIIFVSIVILSGCKKYPKNSIIVVRPESVVPSLFGAKAVYYTVDGVDSLSYMPELMNTKFLFHDIGSCGSLENCAEYQTNIIDNSKPYAYIIESSPHVYFSSDKNYIYNVFKFMPNFDGDGRFKRSIIKLTPKEMIVRTIHKNKVYELKIAK